MRGIRPREKGKTFKTRAGFLQVSLLHWLLVNGLVRRMIALPLPGSYTSQLRECI